MSRYNKWAERHQRVISYSVAWPTLTVGAKYRARCDDFYKTFKRGDIVHIVELNEECLDSQRLPRVGFECHGELLDMSGITFNQAFEKIHDEKR